MNVIERTPPNLRFDGAGERTFKNTLEWLRFVKEAVVLAFPDQEWIVTEDGPPPLDLLINSDIYVAVCAGANEGHRVRILSSRHPRTGRMLPECATLLSIKTLSGIHHAMDIANWLTVALNRFSAGIHVVSCDPAQGMS